MDDFPSFMKDPRNRIASASQHTPGIEGFVYDGIEGSQMAFWTCRESARSAEHVHDYDEYVVVVQGRYTVFLPDGELVLGPGKEVWIAKGLPHAGEAAAGTRTIHAFGGKRAARAPAEVEATAGEIAEASMPETTPYVHGYSAAEERRLLDQASTLTELLHADTAYPAGSLVLEAGCGVGAQTVTLAARSPEARFLSVDISGESLAQARTRVEAAGLPNVAFRRADLFALPFPEAHFDHVFVCFVLEHLARPGQALQELLRVLKPGGTLTAIEGDHGSAYFHPDDAMARKAIGCLVELQRRAGGDALIGRRLFPLLTSAGLRDVRVSPRMVYADASRPAVVDGFTRKTFTAMVEGVGEEAVGEGLMDAPSWRQGIEALYRTADSDGTFCYTFFKGVGTK